MLLTLWVNIEEDINRNSFQFCTACAGCAARLSVSGGA